MTVFWTLIAAIVIGLIIGAALTWWMNRPDPDAYCTAVSRHEAFGRYLNEIQKINQRMAQGGDASERLWTKIRELESRRDEGVDR